MNLINKINSNICIKKFTKDSIPYIIFNLLNKNKLIVYIVENNFYLETIENEIHFYDKNIKVLKFPEWDTLPYDSNSPKIDIQSKRMETLYKLINFNNLYKNQKVLILISINSLYQKVINKQDYKYINLKINQNITLSEINKILEENSYNKVETSINIGDYSINGRTIDLITYNNQPYRIYIKNNTIQKIRNFYINSQISYGNYKNILILPIKELIFNKETINNFKEKYKNLFKIPFSDKILNTYGIENYLPLFYNNKLEAIFDYLPNNSIISYIPFKENKNIQNYYDLRVKNKENVLKTNELYIDHKTIKEYLKKYNNIIFDLNNEINNSFETINLNIKGIPNFFRDSKEIFSDLKNYI